MDEDIIFDEGMLDDVEGDEETLDELLNADAKEEPQEPVEIPESKQRWTPSGPCFRAEMDTDEQVFFVDGKRVLASEMTAETTDPDSMNWLLALQKNRLEPDEAGPIPVGGSYRAPDYEALEQVLEDEMACPVCGEAFTPEDCALHDLGQLVSYGGIVYHWSCLALWMLVICRGHPEKAAQVYHVDLRDMRAIKTSYRAIPWGRLGWRREG